MSSIKDIRLRFGKNYSLEVVVFFAGAIVMVFELSASRILAPYLGSNLIVWTSIIGVILGSLSLGYWAGGKLSDKKPDSLYLSLILFLCALSILFISLSNSYILDALTPLIKDLRVKSTISTIILFGAPSFLLGMVNPFAIRLKLQTLKKAGTVSGNLYAIATAGSIVGTFLGGFLLIPTFGSNKILLLLSLALALLSLIPGRKFIKRIYFATPIFLIIVLLFMPFQYKNVKADLDTSYNRVLVYDGIDPANGRKTRFLSLNGGISNFASSAIYLDNDKDLVMKYSKYFDLFEFFSPESEKVLMIGGGVFSYAKHFVNKYPGKKIDVVEIDPRLTDVATKYFRLKKNPKLTIYNEDGRSFLNREMGNYDAVMLDVYFWQTIPFQLTTIEAVKNISKNLKKDGVAIVNIISSLDGGKNEFLKAQYKTYRKVFPHVYIIPVYPELPKLKQNVMLIAFNSDINLDEADDHEVKKMLKHRSILKIDEKTLILTDDFAPVESYNL